jgi:hypothetical protein
MVQAQLASINNQVGQINFELLSLRDDVNDLELRVEKAEKEIRKLKKRTRKAVLKLNAEIDVLKVQQAATQAQLDQEGVKLYKCNASNSSERIFKINGHFYAVMNRVELEEVEIVTGSSSQTITTSGLCRNGQSDNYYIPNGNSCNGGHSFIPGQIVTVPSYTTKKLDVVTSVKMALDILPNGSYATTDGGPACHFSISGNGTQQSGLVQVQGGL